MVQDLATATEPDIPRIVDLIERLANIGGTGDAITAVIDPVQATMGVTSLSTASSVEYIPSVTNLAANPTLTIGEQSYPVRNADAGAWPAGGFVVGLILPPSSGPAL